MSETKGIYDTLYSALEREALQNAAQTPLDDEIKLVKIAMRRLLKIAKGQSDEEQVKTLVLMSTVAGKLASLLRTQRDLQQTSGNNSENSLRAMLDKVVLEVQIEQNWPIL